MAMSVGSGDDQAAISAINTTPLVDVMLVLLIIFLITIPVITKTVPVTLPSAVNIPTVTKPRDITIAIDKEGNVYWKESRVPTQAALIALVAKAAVETPQPEIHIRADKDVEYKSVGRVLYAIQRGGIVKVAFMTTPSKTGEQ